MAVEYFDTSAAAQAKKYAFKCHRQAIDGSDHVWPVNSLAFHPMYVFAAHICALTDGVNDARRYHTFASAGSDGLVSIWDHTAKKRLRQYPKYHNAVNAVSFNKNGTKLAVGVSYGWDKGAEGARLPESSRVSIYVREVGDEVKVRTLPAFVPEISLTHISQNRKHDPFDVIASVLDARQ